MSRRIAIILGHPDPDEARLCRALAAAYAEGARDAGHHVDLIDVAALEFPLLRSRREWEKGRLPSTLRPAQRAIGRAEHLVIIFPLWLGDMPALLKGFLEQVLRPGFAIGRKRGLPAGKLKDRSARVVVTMGMPSPVYRWYFSAHALKALERSLLGICGIAPVRETIIGSVEAGGAIVHRRRLARLRALGRRAR